MKKIATITFHASYNYGSNLQAYALQEYIKKICSQKCEYKIINLRTNIQKEMYKTCYEKKGLKNIIKRFIKFKQKDKLRLQNERFENFIMNKLDITKEYPSLEELKKEEFDADYYISGSDQIWNTCAIDFDWSNFLEFVSKGKKVSYAASFGPIKNCLSSEVKKRIQDDLESYDCLSVREEGSYDEVKKIANLNANINIDPTMLLTKEQWNNIVEVKPYVSKKYILLYDLKNKPEIDKIAYGISKMMGLPVIITQRAAQREFFYNFEKKYDAGPLEFLNLVKNAELVLSSSFHGTVFSILFNKPFFAINGVKDLRINTLLCKMGLEDRSISIEDYKEKCQKAFDIDFTKSEILLEEERRKSKEYLMKALDIQ